MSLTLKARIALEKRIARTFATDALKAGFTLTVDNGGNDEELGLQGEKKVIGGETCFVVPPLARRKRPFGTGGFNKLKNVMDAMFATDEEKVYLWRDGRRFGWVQFVYGNDGWDVISDYTINLDDTNVFARTNAISDKY